MTEATQRQLTAATLIWMLSVAVSRVAGLLREVVIAGLAGADGMTDVYFMAFQLPDLLNYLLAGGALSVTFIPIFIAFIRRGEEEEGWRVFSTVMNVMMIALTAVIVLAWILAPVLCPILARGFDAEQMRLFVRYTRILLPAQFFFFAGGLFGAVQMARGRHGFYATAPLVYNACIIILGVLLAPRFGMEGFCWGALVGAFLGHGVLQWIGATRGGLRLSRTMDFKAPAARQWMALTVPFIVGQSILALDEPIQRFFASSLPPASISWLNYGRRLMLVLPSILGQAAAVASFPLLSRQVEEGDVRGMRETLSRGLERAVLFAGLGAVGLIVLNREAVQIAFGRGAFTTLDVLTTGRVLAVFAPAVPALVAQAILARGYYALRDTWTPTLIGTAITLGSLPLYGFLARWFAEPGTDRGGGHLGLAWAGTLSLVAYGVLTAVVLERKLRRRDAGGKPLLAPAFLMRTTLVLAGTLVLAALGRGVVGGWLPEVALLPALGRSILVGTWLLACFFGLARLAGLSQATAPLGALAARRLR